MSEQIAVAIPTANSAQYIGAALSRIAGEVRRLPSDLPCEILVGLNGPDPDDRTRGALRSFAQANPDLRVHIVRIAEQGKNGTLNALIDVAKHRDATIIHFLDDDVALQPGSLHENIATLVDVQSKSPIPILVGSRFWCRRHSIDYFLQRSGSPAKALAAWFWHCTFRIAFREGPDEPRFCAGVSICAYLRSLPRLPADSSAVADDAFWDNYYAARGKDHWLASGVSPIVKPARSVAYFEVPTSLAEWFRQQVRTYVGVMNANDHFAADLPFLVSYFRWPYSFGDFRCLPVSLSFNEVPFFCFYAAIRRVVMTVGELKRRRGRRPAWSVARSSKF
jgi:Glycosyl transferase family 2